MEQFVANYQPPAAPPQPTYQPQPVSHAPAAAQAGGYSPPDPALAYNDPAAYQAQLIAFNDARTQAALMQGAGPLFQNQAEMARINVSRDPDFAQTFSRYGPEVDAEIAGVPSWQRNMALYQKAAEVVRGRHYRDFVAEEIGRASCRERV